MSQSPGNASGEAATAGGPVAATTYDMRVVRHRASRLRRVLRYAWSCCIFFLTPFYQETRQEATVEVLRKSDGAVVASYDYDFVFDALVHVGSLRQRLDTMTVPEFKSDLGIP